jgi:mevalonate kinase
MTTISSNGKLLLTAEYVVLDGAKALALPTTYGQALNVEPIDQPKLYWKSMDHKGKIWFENVFSIKTIASGSSNPCSDISKRIVQILYAAKQLNPAFLSAESGFIITTKLDFPENWGLGSSSTLINNIAQWAMVDAYELLALTFGGSGYDIACAQHKLPITFTLDPLKKSRTITTVDFNPSFKDQLFFVHLNQKQNSREGIKHYHKKKNNLSSAISEIDVITKHIINCKVVSEFETLILKHEQIISKLIDLPTVKSALFKEYPKAIKSLGAWGGDFILATGSFDDRAYFRQKGYHTIISYSDMIPK